MYTIAIMTQQITRIADQNRLQNTHRSPITIVYIKDVTHDHVGLGLGAGAVYMEDFIPG